MWRNVGGIVIALLLLTTSDGFPAPQTFLCDGGFGPAVDPPIPLASLKTASNPVFPGGVLRGDLTDFIRSKDAAVQLGKALFWEMQAGSDNRIACATCHFHAGADRRSRNQLNPGANGAFDAQPPNSILQSAHFPFTDRLAGFDTDDTAGSQGIRKSQFKGFGKTGAELTAAVADSVFTENGKNVRRVTGMQTPAVVNAVFNHRNFWNGRAQSDFNGVNPFGGRDLNARVWVLSLSGSPVKLDIHLQNASLASQALGPPLSDVEMSAIGRTFPDIGKKLLRFKPLGLQQVSPTDSVLGILADTTTGKGLKVSYTSLIQQAFQPKWWNSTKKVTVGAQSYTMTEANFSLFWGLSIMLYEATLVSDDTPVDQYLDSGRTNAAALDVVVERLNAEGVGITRANILTGLNLFETPQAAGGKGCIECHGGAELTTASAANVLGLKPADVDLKNLGFDFRMERMFMQFPAVPAGTMGVTYDPSVYAVTAILSNGDLVPVPIGVYDAGFYNIGVRPTSEGLGLGGLDPFGKPLSFTRLFQRSGSPSLIKVPGEILSCALTGQVAVNLSGPLLANERAAEDGVFKVPALRNVELNGPYFHNGGKATLRQTLEFYDAGADFPTNPDLAPLIQPLGMTPEEIDDLIAFLVALTDERVRSQRAPFDHPQLGIPNGQNPDGSDIIEWLPAVGASGAVNPLERFLSLNPFQP